MSRIANKIGSRIGTSVGSRIGASGSAVLVSISVTPATPLISTTATQQMTATGTYSDTSTSDITASVTWDSGTPGTCTISAGGLVSAVAGGISTITATLGLISGNTTMCVCPKDATSGIFCPLTQGGWTAVFTKAGVTVKTVSHSWGFQDASGNPAATVGTALTQAGTAPTYQQAISGWTRKSINSGDNSTTSLQHGSGAGTNPSTTSSLWIGYIDILASVAAARNVMSLGGAAASSEMAGRSNATPVTQIKVMAPTAVGTSNPSTGGVRPWVLKYNRTGSEAVLATDQEKIAGTYNSGVTDGVKGFGAGITNAAGIAVALGANFAGAHAEWTDAEIKSVLQTLGWTIPW